MGWSSETAGGGVGAALQGIWAEKLNQGAGESGLASVSSGSGSSGACDGYRVKAECTSLKKSLESWRLEQITTNVAISMQIPESNLKKNVVIQNFLLSTSECLIYSSRNLSEVSFIKLR